jgi:fucose permease
MTAASTSLEASNRKRLFAGICLALVPTGASFALVSNILGQLKAEFILTNVQVGYIGGAALWGMALSLLIIGPALEGFGLKRGTQMAFLGHVAGLTLMISAVLLRGEPSGFWLLMAGAAVLAMGHGMIEVAGNPLTAALYPDQKTIKLNWFHAFFPIGITGGAIVGFLMAQSGIFVSHWTWQLAVIYIPIGIYGYMVLPQKFPKTEGAEAGLPVGEMFRYTLTHPLFLLLLAMKAITVSIELAPMRWVQEFLIQLGIHGILVLAWISAIMVVLRLFASHFVERFSPTGMLLGGAMLTGISLFLMSLVETTGAAFAVATVFGIGIAFFFPTMLGVVSERLPKTGSLGIVLTAGVGLAAAGAVGVPAMGGIADRQISSHLQEHAPAASVEILRQARQALPAYLAQAEGATSAELAELGFRPRDVRDALAAVEAALAEYSETGEIHGNAVPNAFRAIIGSGIPLDAEIAAAIALLRPAEAAGFQSSFRSLSPLAILLVIVFGTMYIQDRRKGGYRAVRLGEAEAKAAEASLAGSNQKLNTGEPSSPE